MNLPELYDKHAAEVYGYALLVTRRKRRARTILTRAFEEAARRSEGGDVVAIGKTMADARRPRKIRRWLYAKPSRALDPASPIAKEVDVLQREVAEKKVADASAWRRPPRSMRALVLMRAREAREPFLLYARWLAVWMFLAMSIGLAVWSESSTPRLPSAGRPLTECFTGLNRMDRLEADRDYDLVLQGFRQERR